MVSRSFALSLCLWLTTTAPLTDAQTLRSESQRVRKHEFAAPGGIKTVVRGLEGEFDDLVGGVNSVFNSMPPTTAPPVTTPPGSGPPVTSAPVTSAPVTAAPVSPAPGSPTLAPSVSQAPSATGIIPTTSPTTSAPVGGGLIPTQGPTSSDCGMSEDDRIAGILAILDAVADPDLIRDNSHPQGLATTWLIQETGAFRVCPNDTSCHLLQRWVLAVIYYSTNGNAWFQCSANPNATDPCGTEEPFIGDTRFLSDTSECDWAGIGCIQGCVTEIIFEANNLVGVVATEIGLLPHLRLWGMERGGLTGPIPTEIGQLKNLTFIDLDFNALTGSLSSELLSLSGLTQLDLNNNRLTGSVNGIGVFPKLEFLQIHNNFFTGTVPETLGESTKLAAFTLHHTAIVGTMPQSICDLLQTENNGGVLTSLIADCSLPNPEIECNCCTDCRK